MDTKIVTASKISEAAEIIKNGGVVAFPTETVYGLGADAYNPAAVKKIFEAKGRPQDNPLIVHIADDSDMFELACEIPEVFFKLKSQFMPGPLTVILKKSEKVPFCVTAGGETVGIRMPKNQIALDFLKACNTPIAAPSANRSTHISPTSAQHVFDDLSGKIPMIIDGGDSEIGLESTVLDLTQEIPVILRPGAVTAEMLMSVLGSVAASNHALGIAKSPGMKYRHYAAKATTVLVPDITAATELYDKKSARGFAPVIIAKQVFNSTNGNTAQSNEMGARNVFDLGATSQEAAKNIYRLMREAEKEHDFIIIEAFGETGIEAAISNRLSKAAEKIETEVNPDGNQKN